MTAGIESPRISSTVGAEFINRNSQRRKAKNHLVAGSMLQFFVLP